MFCANCGRKIEDGMSFCPGCGTPVPNENNNDTFNMSGGSSHTDPQRGVWAEKNFGELRQETEKAEKNAKIWKTIGTVLLLAVLFLLVRNFISNTEDIISGNASGLIYLYYISTLGLFACAISYCLFIVILPFMLVKKSVRAEKYLNLIRVNDTQEFMRILNQLRCVSIKNVYRDEKGNICIQGKRSKHVITITDQIPVLTSLKDNYKVILEQESIAENLLKAVEPEAPINAYENERRNSRLSTAKMMLGIFAVIFGGIFVWLTLNPELLENGQKYVRFVKEASPEAYPDITYGDAFEAFFANCNWEYFQSTEGQDVVEFTGNCMYDNETVTVKIQFLVSYDEGRGEFYTMSINDEVQPELVQALLITEVFNDFGSGADTNTLQLEEEQEDTRMPATEESGQEASQQETSNEVETSGNGIVLSPEPAVDLAANTSSLSFPILFQGYLEYSPCPVMVQDESGDMLRSGSYSDMLSSCVDDGTTMYASPNLYNGAINLPTKWDAFPDLWYEGLLTYQQFLFVIEWMTEEHDYNGVSQIYTYVSWEDTLEIPGSWNGGGKDISISIYSDWENGNIYKEIGNWTCGNDNGLVYLLGKSDKDVFILCEADNGSWMVLRYDGTLTVDSRNGFDVEDGTQFTCTEHYMS